MNNFKKLGLLLGGLVTLLAVLMFCFVPFAPVDAASGTPSTFKRNLWTSLQIFKNGLRVTGDIDHTGDINQTGDMNQAGDYDTTGSIKVGDEFVQTVYYYSGVSNLALSAGDGNIIFLAAPATGGVTTYHVQLPAITADIDGMRIIIKNMFSGVSVPVISGCTSGGYSDGTGSGFDCIEATQGTMSGVTYIKLDAAGDAAEFIADYVSGTTSVWRMISEDIS